MQVKPNLPEQIRALPCNVPTGYPFGSDLCAGVYRQGHRDARHAAAELAAAALSAAPAQEPRWVELTDEDRQAVHDSLPDALDGFLKLWGWLHFAKAIEAKVREKNAHLSASPLPQEPQEVKALTPERVAEIAEGYPEKWAATPGFLPWFARAIERELRGAQEGKAVEWRTVERDGLPPCDGETVFVGINSAGFACCFNEARPDGLCLMGSPECSTAQMSELRWWRVLDRPSSREGEQR